jgi:hypothetical protein
MHGLTTQQAQDNIEDNSEQNTDDDHTDDWCETGEVPALDMNIARHVTEIAQKRDTPQHGKHKSQRNQYDAKHDNQAAN